MICLFAMHIIYLNFMIIVVDLMIKRNTKEEFYK